MRIRLSINYRVVKVLANIEVIVAIFNKANEVSLIIRPYYCNKILINND